MMNQGKTSVLAAAYLVLCACAVPDQANTPASMRMLLGEELQPISDVHGPYGAVSYRNHAVAVRLWPDTLDDGLAELTVIVTNGSWNTISLDVDNIRLATDGIETPVLGQTSMLARTTVLPGQSNVTASGDIDPGNSNNPKTSSSALQTGAVSSRLNSEIGATPVDPALAAAARRVNANRRPAALRNDPADLEEQRKIITDWYLNMIEIYPGDTGTGGISIPVPDASAKLELRISIGDEDYVFPIDYRE